MLSRVLWGSGSPNASTPDIPALCASHANGAPRASSTMTVASTISGPMPSPAINVAGITFFGANCTFGTTFYVRLFFYRFQLIRRPNDFWPHHFFNNTKPSRYDPLRGIWSPNRRQLNDLRKFETSISTVTQYRSPRFLLESTFAGRRIIFLIFRATSTQPRGQCERVRGILRVEETRNLRQGSFVWLRFIRKKIG